MIAVPTIATALKKELGSYFSTEAHRDNDMVRYINSAARAIAISKNFGFNKYKYTLEVVDDQTVYSIPYQIETLLVKKGLDEIDYFNFIDYNQEEPSEFGIWEETVETTTPGTYNIFYRGFPEQITSLLGNLNIPQHFYDLVLLKATYFGFMDIRAYNKAADKEAIYKGMIVDMATRSSDPQPRKTKRLNKSKSKQW